MMLLSKNTKWLFACCLTVAAIGFGLHIAARFPNVDEETTKVDGTLGVYDASRMQETLLSGTVNISAELASIRNANLAQAEALQTLKQQIVFMQKQQQSLIDKLYRLETGENARHAETLGYKPPDDGLTEEQRIEKFKQQNIAVVEATINSEKIDVAWQATMESELAASMRTLDLVGSQLTQIQCANSLCKISLNHKNQETLDEFMQKIPSVKPWNTGAYVDTQQQGSSYATVIYLAREGKSLPEPERFQ